MTNALRDLNRVPVALGVSNADATVTLPFKIDSVTGRLIVDASASTSLTIGTSTITSGTNGRVLYDNAGVVGEMTTTGSGTVLALATSPVFVTPALGTPASGVATNLTGTASGLTAGNVTTNANLTGGVTSVGNAATVVTNANLTGVITSVGNATSIASQTGTGTKFVTDTSPTLVTPLLGTPTSGTLTNCTGLPVAGIVASTSTALGVGSIELGAASDTTIARVSAGVISVEGVTVDTISATNTLTNKRVTRRVVATTQSATPTINTDNTDVAYITALAQAVTSFTTNLSGTPVNGDCLIIDITDNGTARALTFGTSFEASTVALPTTTVISTKLTIGFRWNTATSKWTCVAVA